MTNADKYLKDGVDVEELATKIIEYGVFGDTARLPVTTATWEQAIIDFMNKPIKPTLTEDEKVILRNMIPQVKTIQRDTDGELILKICNDTIAEDFCYSGAFVYDHLFQFIQPRRRI